MVKQNSKKNELINALLKLLYIRITELYKKWNNRPISNWDLVRNKLDMDENLKERVKKYQY